MVSSMLGNHLYSSAMSSPYVHQFVPTLHFPLPDRVKEYRVGSLGSVNLYLIIIIIIMSIIKDKKQLGVSLLVVGID